MMPHKNNFDRNEEILKQIRLDEKILEQNQLTANEVKRKSLKIMLIGCPEAVMAGIHHFHLTGQAQVGDWCRLQPCPHNPDEMMSISVRRITIR